MSDLRLRAWALAQFLYLAALFLRGSLVRMGSILIGRDTARRDMSIRDMGGVVKDELFRTAFLGHVNACAFSGLDNDFPELMQGNLASVILLHSVAVRSLERLVTGVPSKTGWLRGYARGQLRHFKRCTECRAYVYGAIREDVARTRHIRALMRRAGLSKISDR